MSGRMRTSPAGIDLIMRFEGFRETSAELPSGGYVIGYGHTTHAKARQRITEDDARTLLKGHDLPPIEKAIMARTLAPLSQNEFDALVAFAFNIGLENFLESDVFALVNSGAKLNAAEAMASWRKARVDGRVIVVDALVRRRAAERALFLEVPGGPTPAPTPLVRPVLDLASAIMHPREAARQVTAEEDDETGAVRLGIAGEDATAAARPAKREEDEPRRETAPEAAARAVTERLTRILGDEAGLKPANDIPPRSEGPSVEEITQAVSELADPQPANGDPQVASNDDDAPRNLPPPMVQPKTPPVQAVEAPGEEDEEPGEAEAGPGEATVEVNGTGHPAHTDHEDVPDHLLERSMVDDLEEIAAQTLARDPDFDPEVNGAPAPWGSLLLYGLAAFGGAMIGAWGLDHLLDAMSSTSPLQSDWDLYAGPFALMVGALIFLVMTYYLLRALFSKS